MLNYELAWVNTALKYLSTGLENSFKKTQHMERTFFNILL